MTAKCTRPPRALRACAMYTETSVISKAAIQLCTLTTEEELSIDNRQQARQRFKVILGFTTSSRTAWAAVDPASKNNLKQKTPLPNPQRIS